MGELRGRALWAWVVVCVLWGSTYLAIRVGVETLPPFLMAGVRFLVAGAILGAVVRGLGERLPTRREDWKTLSLTGVLLLAGGNGLVVWAEQYVDAGTASIYVVTVVLWSACFDALIPGGKTRLSWALAGGLLLGLLGTTVLVGVTPRELLATDLRGPLALVLASAFWAFGTVYFKRHPVAAGSSVIATVQMLVGGVVLLGIGLLFGEQHQWRWTTEGMAALGYLVVLGSIVGMTAYSYALKHASATVVGTYAYVNPVVAVLLGALILGEELGPRKLLAMAIILGAVLWIQYVVSPKRVREPQPA